METKFTKSTDKEHKIKLESSIIYATWSANEIHAGSEAGVEVRTLFVGEGSKIKITGKSEKGKKLGKLTGEVYGNGFTGKLTIPDKIKPGDFGYFEVKLPGLGANAESNRVSIRPKIEVSNMKWDKKEALQGDTLKLTANVEGVRNESEVKVIIYEYDQDGNHDRIAEIPAYVKKKKVEVEWEYNDYENTGEIISSHRLQEGDETKRSGQGQAGYFFVVESSGQKFGVEQESRLLALKTWIEIELVDAGGKPMAEEAYWIKPPDGDPIEGKLDKDGRAYIDDITAGFCIVKFPGIDKADWKLPAYEKPTTAARWIEFELVDAKGKPMADEAYWIKPPDGDPIEGKLDKDGKARMDDIKPGLCVVRFPNIDKNDWVLPSHPKPPEETKKEAAA